MLHAWCKYRNMEYVEGHVRPLPSDNFEQGFLSGIEYTLSIPIAERITNDERGSIKARHDRREQVAELYLEATCINAQESSAIDFCKGYAQALRDVFGSEMLQINENEIKQQNHNSCPC